MQNTFPDPATPDDAIQQAVEARARLNELPGLICATNEQGGAKASQVLRTEKGRLEEYVPVLEARAHLFPIEAHHAQIAQWEQELLDAEITLHIATRLSAETKRAFELSSQNPDQVQGRAIEIANNLATAQMHEARHRVATLRLELAKLKARFRQKDPLI